MNNIHKKLEIVNDVTATGLEPTTTYFINPHSLST